MIHKSAMSGDMYFKLKLPGLGVCLLNCNCLQAPYKDAVRDVCVQSHRRPGRLLAETTAATLTIPVAQAAQV